MSYLFISHSSKNNFHAIAIQDWLVTQGWDELFLDLDPERGIVAGQRWEKALHDAASRCDAVLFLVSQDWLDSEWCRKEFRLAHRLNKRIIGLLIEDIDIDTLPDELTSTWQLINLATGNDHQLIAAVHPDTGEEQHVHYSKTGLTRLKTGLVKAGLDPMFYQWPPENDLKRSPYRGMLPLEAEDAGIFFGREAPTNELLAKLRGLRADPPPRFMVVLGASGSGKSSFLRAGVLPRLSRDERNFATLPIIRPEQSVLWGDNGLLSCLDKSCNTYRLGINKGDIQESIKSNPDEIIKLLIKISENAKPPRLAGETNTTAPTLIMTIDQGEELFHSEGSEQSQAFLNLLQQLVTHKQLPLIILFTIRSDSYERLQTHQSLEGISQQTFSLAPMPQGAYKSIIEGPVSRLIQSGRLFGAVKDASDKIIKKGKLFELDLALTHKLLEDIEKGGNKDALPILAFTLERLFDLYGKNDGDLTLDEYYKMGGLKGAIKKAVEIVIENAKLDPSLPNDETAINNLLRRGLIPWLAGIDPDTQSTRRRVAKLSEIPIEARPIIDHLIQQRLLSTDTETITDDGKTTHGETTIEPAHESLLRQWGLLDDWLQEDLAVLTTLEAVQRASRDWAANNQHQDYLAHNAGRLQDAEGLKQRDDISRFLTQNDWEYLKQCRELENQQRDKELAEAKKLAQAQKKVAKRTTLGMIAALILTLVAGFMWWQSYKAEKLAEKNEQLALKAKQETDKALDKVRENINFMNFELRDAINQYVPLSHQAKIIKNIDNLLESIQTSSATDGDKRNIAAALLNKVDLILKNSEMDPSEALGIAQQAHKLLNEIQQENPNNSQFKSDLSISYEKIAGIQLRLGKTDEALDGYEQSLQIAKELIKLDPNNSQFKRDLTLSIENIAGIQLRLGKTDEALDGYEQSLQIRKELIKLDPNNSQFKRDLIVSYYKLAVILEKLKRDNESINYYNLALNNIYKSDSKLESDDKENMLKIFSSGIASLLSSQHKYQDAANHLMKYFETIGIDVNSKQLIPEQVILLNQRTDKYTSWSWYLLFTKNHAKITPTLNNLFKYLDKDNKSIIYLNGNLAHAYILSGDYESAKAIYTQFKDQKFPDGRSWDTVVIENFKALKEEGIEHPDFIKIAKEVFGVDEF